MLDQINNTFLKVPDYLSLVDNNLWEQKELGWKWEGSVYMSYKSKQQVQIFAKKEILKSTFYFRILQPL